MHNTPSPAVTYVGNPPIAVTVSASGSLNCPDLGIGPVPPYVAGTPHPVTCPTQDVVYREWPRFDVPADPLEPFGSSRLAVWYSPAAPLPLDPQPTSPSRLVAYPDDQPGPTHNQNRRSLYDLWGDHFVYVFGTLRAATCSVVSDPSGHQYLQAHMDWGLIIVGQTITVAGSPPPVGATNPFTRVVAGIEGQWSAGTAMTAPAGDFVVFLPTCVWTVGAQFARTLTLTNTVAAPDDPATGRHVWLQYTLTVVASPPMVDWGDGTEPTALDPDNTAPADPADPQAMAQACPTAPTNHLYKKVSGDGLGYAQTPVEGALVTVTQEVEISIGVAWWDGQVEHSQILSDTHVPLTSRSNGRHVVKQIEPVITG